MRAITGRTQIYCVIGDPVGHSLSPLMQNAALAALGEDAVYVAFRVRTEQLGTAIAGLEALGVRGLNATIPHKERLLDYMTELTAEAEFIGAVNTVRFGDGVRVGHNTDAPGFLAALRWAIGGRLPHRAVILGAGGSARAVSVALAREGIEIVLANRTEERALALAERLNRRIRAGIASVVPLTEAGVRSALDSADLLVNTTSLGMAPQTEAMPPVPAEALRPELFVCDLVYNPAETRLLALARARGCRTQNGVPMLAYQGALALEFWLGRPAPAALMQATLEAALAGGTPTS